MGEDRKIPSRDRYIDAVFESGGYLSTVFAGYRPRAGQVALARAVDHAIAERTHLLAEGPTGTGKSLAYAVPASYYAWETGRPVVIVTANIALQEQIVNKDLPLLQKIAPWPFTFALLKGRNNYLCEDRRADYEANLYAKRSLVDIGQEERHQLDTVRAWANACHAEGPNVEDGDMSDLPFEPLHSVWRQFSVSADECKKGNCRHRAACFPNRALERARGSNVIVTNYHMLFAHLKVFIATGVDVVLPAFEVAVLDEAHKAADIARDFFGFKISQDAVKRIVRRAQKRGGIQADSIERAATYFFAMMGALKKDPKRYKARLTGDFLSEELDAWSRLSVGLAEASIVFETRMRELAEELQRIKDDGGGLSKEADDVQDEIGEIELDVERCMTIHTSLRHAMAPKDHTENVFFLEEDDKGRVTMCSKLVRPGDVLRPTLFEKVAVSREADGSKRIGNPLTVVATSATLATNGTSFGYIAAELGVPEGYGELVAQSPFDWPKQCLFIVPAGMPQPNEPEFRDAVARTVERTVLLAGGRTLALFTSRRVLEHTYDAIIGTCRKQRITLLKQGDEPRSKLIARFKEDTTSVLLGTESFWAGVDVPGESCSVVIIDRLPFPTPDDPVLDVQSSIDNDWFWKYSVPRAMISFKQGFGRLIRSNECRGVVVCLDARLATKRYGKDFLRSLPAGIPKSTRLESLVDWLNPPAPEAWDAL